MRFQTLAIRGIVSTCSIPHHSNTYTQYTQQHYNTSSKEHEKIGDEFWTVRSITIDELRPGCVLWAYDDAGCHFGGKKIEPKTCMGDDKYYRTYYLAYN
ncbi:hypothetical protein N0V84_005636 [Fusarium piperis]|uniref:Uncharacterized protein n=1 Tax=Fusarium piperis TaxID=1435070 RepID=A0A9W9BNW4_9HYPO|nr:hypothetical protein N0V84_005636 [Fusarium piperis]